MRFNFFSVMLASAASIAGAMPQIQALLEQNQNNFLIEEDHQLGLAETYSFADEDQPKRDYTAVELENLIKTADNKIAEANQQRTEMQERHDKIQEGTEDYKKAIKAIEDKVNKYESEMRNATQNISSHD